MQDAEANTHRNRPRIAHSRNYRAADCELPWRLHRASKSSRFLLTGAVAFSAKIVAKPIWETCFLDSTCRSTVPFSERALNRRHAIILRTNGRRIADMTFAGLADWLKTTITGIVLLGAAGSVIAYYVLRFVEGAF